MNRARAVLTALVLASALTLAGCTDDDPEPKFSPPSSEPPESPSTTAASGPTAPEMPEAAKGTDAAAAEAFVKFYWAMVRYAQETGQLDGLRQLSADRCVACKAGIEYLERVFSDGGVISGGVSRVRQPRTVFVKDGGVVKAVVEFNLATTPQRVDYPAEGPRDEVYQGGTSAMRARLQPSGDAGWAMEFWGEQ